MTNQVEENSKNMELAWTWGGPGWLLVRSWRRLGRPWADLGPLLAALGPLLGPPERLLGPPGRLWAAKTRFSRKP